MREANELLWLCLIFASPLAAFEMVEVALGEAPELAVADACRCVLG